MRISFNSLGEIADLWCSTKAAWTCRFTACERFAALDSEDCGFLLRTCRPRSVKHQGWVKYVVSFGLHGPCRSLWSKIRMPQWVNTHRNSCKHDSWRVSGWDFVVPSERCKWCGANFGLCVVDLAVLILFAFSSDFLVKTVGHSALFWWKFLFDPHVLGFRFSGSSQWVGSYLSGTAQIMKFGSRTFASDDPEVSAWSCRYKAWSVYSTSLGLWDWCFVHEAVQGIGSFKVVCLPSVVHDKMITVGNILGMRGSSTSEGHSI